MHTEKTYLKPNHIEHAIQLALAQPSTVKFVAGGTDVMVNKFQGNDTSSCYIDICHIAELKQITHNETHLIIGSTVTLDDLICNSDVQFHFPWLQRAACAIASPVIRKTATIGGNLLCENRCIFYNQSAWWREAIGYCLKCDGDICIATGGKKKCFSKFVSDLAVALISANATIEVIDHERSYLTQLETIYTGDGLKPHHLHQTALIKAIHLPLNKTNDVAFYKLRRRESLEFSSLTTAVSLCRSGAVRIVLGGVDPKPIVLDTSMVDTFAKDHPADVIQQLLKAARVIDNDVFSRAYRREMIGVHVHSAWELLSRKLGQR